MTWRDISEADMAKFHAEQTRVFLWFPVFGSADVGMVNKWDCYGQDAYEWVDQWNSEVYETGKSERAEPSHFQLIESPQEEE